MDRKRIIAKLKAELPDAIVEEDLEATEPFIRVEAAAWGEVARVLKDRAAVDLLSCLSGIDRGDELEAIYNLESTQDPKNSPFSVRIKVGRADPTIPSVEGVWRTADWHEREAFDLVGLRFSGHPNLRRILCAEDWEGHPLRKDYRSPDYYHGIRNNVV